MVTHENNAQNRADAVRQEMLGTIVLTLMALEKSDTLILPAAEDQLEQTKKTLEIEDFAQAVIAGADYNIPCLDRLIPTDCITVEYANEMAQCLQRLKKDGEVKKYSHHR